ncbi:MAG: SDR family NAD(P)-dependent oxidoreductase [Myxococcales bacterium]|nr:SDR family NAD(P)-dependent oxidoreductase [Myxococcales bacterium]
MTKRLEGRRVLLTGVSRGVGLETAKRFLTEGARVLGVARDKARLARGAEVLGRLGDFVPEAADLTDPGAAPRIADAVQKRWGALDVLLNNAAILVDTGKSFETEPAGTFESTLEANLVAPFRLTSALLPLLRRGSEPRIIHVGSGAGTFEGVRQQGIASYRLSKWALNGLTILQATQLKGEIAVNAFDPGWVKTDLGGPNAPGDPKDSAEGALAVATLAFEVTGKFWKDGREIPY